MKKLNFALLISAALSVPLATNCGLKDLFKKLKRNNHSHATMLRLSEEESARRSTEEEEGEPEDIRNTTSSLVESAMSPEERQQRRFDRLNAKLERLGMGSLS